MTIFDWIFYKVPECNCFRLLARNARYEHPHMEGGKGEESIRSVWTRDVSEHVAEIFQAPYSSLWKSRDLELWKLQLAVSKSSHCYNKDCWKSKGFLSHFTPTSSRDYKLFVGFKVLSLYQLRREAEANHVLKCKHVFVVIFIPFIMSGESEVVLWHSSSNQL